MNDGGFSRSMGRKIRASQYAKKKKAQTEANTNLSPKQFPEVKQPEPEQPTLFDMPAPNYYLNH
jgi:hypothetical protein